jgi:hypothetical protein
MTFNVCLASILEVMCLLVWYVDLLERQRDWRRRP